MDPGLIALRTGTGGDNHQAGADNDNGQTAIAVLASRSHNA